MKTKELPIYTHQICKGNALKTKACRLFSFSEKEKGMMKRICNKLGLSNLVYEEAKAIYYEYLKAVVNTTGLNTAPKYPIVACVYLSALKNRDPRYKSEIKNTLGIATPTTSNWAQKISDALGLAISWKGTTHRSVYKK